MHLAAALRAGWRVLSSGGSSVAAVEAAVVSMEDSPHFNAGFGAVLNEAGEHELDASIMDGSNLAAGAVCAVRRTRHPVAAARAVMEHSSCVLIAGAAADAFAERQGLEIVENSFFTTPQRVQSLATFKQRGALGTIASATEAEKHGTVGAAALDSSGTLAAATSTGGFTNKPVRHGDACPPTRAAAPLCNAVTARAQLQPCMSHALCARAMSMAPRGSESAVAALQLSHWRTVIIPICRRLAALETRPSSALAPTLATVLVQCPAQGKGRCS